jgi:exosome complex RNA-binding protein Csl4
MEDDEKGDASSETPSHLENVRSTSFRRFRESKRPGDILEAEFQSVSDQLEPAVI